MQQHHHLTAREWDELAGDPDFRGLQRARRRFTLPATIFALAFYLALPVAIALWPAFMSERIAGPLTRASFFALLQFAMAWLMLAVYMRIAKAFDARAEAVAQKARERFSR